jgi:peroxiredoxin
MTTNLQLGDPFPDFKLPNHRNELMQLSQFTKPSLLDEKLEFEMAIH